MGFRAEATVKSGSRADYVKSIIDQLMEVADEKYPDNLLAWQQDIAKSADIPLAAPYAPVMTALEMCGLVQRYTADEKEGMGKANTLYAWVGDDIELVPISNDRPGKSGRPRADEEPSRKRARKSRDDDEDEAPRSRKSRRSRDEDYDDEPEEDGFEDEEDVEDVEERPSRRSKRGSEVTPRSRRASSQTSRRHLDEDEDDTPDDDMEEETPRRGRRGAAATAERPSRSRVSHRVKDEDNEPEDEPEEAPVEETPRRRRPRRRAE